MKTILQNKKLLFACVVLLPILFCLLFADVIAPHDPVKNNLMCASAVLLRSIRWERTPMAAVSCRGCCWERAIPLGWRYWSWE